MFKKHARYTVILISGMFLLTLELSVNPVRYDFVVTADGSGDFRTVQEVSFYLGRPWRPFGTSVFLRCGLGIVIKPEGWHNWDKPEAEKNAFFAEYNNSGPEQTRRKELSGRTNGPVNKLQNTHR
jgi:pectin methylesterase-like acyl-CoA thioesterase